MLTPQPETSSSGSNSTQAPPVPSVYKTGSSFNSCDGLVVDGAIGGTQCRITIDTGSNISIVRPDILQEGAQVLPVSSYLRTVTGATAPIRGRGDVSLQIGGLQTANSMWVADIADQCILGLDFLESHGCRVEVPVRVLNLSDKPKRFNKGSDLATCTPVMSVVGAPKGASDSDLGGHKIKVPDSLQSLYERSVTNLSEDQRPLLYNLLGRNADVFSCGPGDLGHTDRHFRSPCRYAVVLDPGFKERLLAG